MFFMPFNMSHRPQKRDVTQSKNVTHIWIYGSKTFFYGKNLWPFHICLLKKTSWGDSPPNGNMLIVSIGPILYN